MPNLHEFATLWRERRDNAACGVRERTPMRNDHKQSTPREGIHVGTGRVGCSDVIGTSARHWQDACWQRAAEVVVDDFGKEGGSKYSWKTFPRSSWPSYHRLDASFAQMKLFVYPLPIIGVSCARLCS